MGLFKKSVVLLLAAAICALNLTGCSQDSKKSNEKPLVVGYLQFSGKFSPFFADSGYDNDAVNMTQIQLMTTDRTGGIIYNSIEGEKNVYNGTEYTYTGISDISVNYDENTDMTVYNIKIRDDVKFSDGEVLDVDDIIFTYYVLADTSYDGSSTLYSTPIIGMQNYRLNNSLAEVIDVSPDEIKDGLENPTDEIKAEIKEKIIEPVLKSAFDFAQQSYEDYTDAGGNSYFDGKSFYIDMYNIDEGYDDENKTDEEIVADIIEQYGADYKMLGLKYAGSEEHFAKEAEEYAADIILKDKLESSEGENVPNISGIKKISQTEVEVTTRGYEANAIYNICGIAVAPMHYYGNEAEYDYDNNKFGFTRGDLSSVKSHTSSPMGAGPYKFIKYENKIIYYEANPYYYKGEPQIKYVQFKETLDADKISGISQGVIDITDPSGSKAAFDEIRSYNTDTKELDGNTIMTSLVNNLGYGYIGINADTVNVGGNPDSEESKNLRKALATIISVYRDQAIDSYYGEAASIINYPISATSWAAPQKTDEDYRVAYSVDTNGNAIYKSDMSADEKYAAAKQAAIEFLKAAGYTFDEAKGIFTAAPEGAKLEYEIIIPASGAGNHPCFAILTFAREALESIGITLTINDPTDSTILWDKLDAQTQELWVAAWGATIDPDLYQVYHSSNIIGNGGSDSNHYHINDAELDKLIIDARKSDDQSYRKIAYKECLDIILDWGVEIPVYQRQNCLIFSTQRVDMSTVTPDITTFWGWMNDIQNLRTK